MFRRADRWIAGALLLAIATVPGRADVQQVRLGVKGIT